MNKITIAGVPASGKTTLANKIGVLLNLPVYHLDKIAWKDNGEFVSQTEAIEKVSALLQEPKWIIEGSMPRSKTFDMRLEAADTIIFYDIPLWLILWRQTKRFFKYFGNVRPDMGGNNKQKYPFTWGEIQYVKKYPRTEIYGKILPLVGSKKVVIIKNRKDERKFLQNINES